MTDENDLTDRFNELSEEEASFRSEWEGEQNPPPSYGEPHPQTVFEEVGLEAWVWKTMNKEARIQFSGNTVEIEE